jgi:hypothetical protein
MKKALRVLLIILGLSLMGGVALAHPQSSTSSTQYGSCSWLCCRISGVSSVTVGAWEAGHGHYSVTARAETSITNVTFGGCDTVTCWATFTLRYGSTVAKTMTSGGALGQTLAVATWTGDYTDRAVSWTVSGDHSGKIFNHNKLGYDAYMACWTSTGAVPAP